MVGSSYRNREKVKSPELLAEFDLGGSLDAKREADSYCLNSTSVAPWPP
jgi:hypothetical protein